MSKQSSLDHFIKCKSSPGTPLTVKKKVSPKTSIMSNKNSTKKRISLSLVRTTTPEETDKVSTPSDAKTVNAENEIVNLCSDDENSFPTDINNDNNLTQNSNTSEVSNSSETTNISDAKTVNAENEIVNLCSDDENSFPTDINNDNNLTQNSNTSEVSNSSETTNIYNFTAPTPQKSPKSTSKNGRSQEKFYSPSKKRAVTKRTPVKRNLAGDSFNNSVHTPTKQLRFNKDEDEELTRACDGLDDKSKFLLTDINKCLKDNSLKALLDDRSVEALECCFTLKKPGIRLVSRLFWRKHGWYRKEQLFQIINDIGDPQFMEILESLIENGLVNASATIGRNTMDFNDLEKVLKSDELKQICKDLKLKCQSKQDAGSSLRSYSQQKSISSYFSQTNSNNLERVLDLMKSKAGTCYKLSEVAISAINKLYLLTYLGMNYEAIREKRLELILIHDKINKEPYPIDKDMVLDNASVVFRSKGEFAKYWYAHTIYEDYLAAMDNEEKCSIILKVSKLYNEIDEEDLSRYKALPTWLRRYTPPYLYVKILEAGISELKKDKTYHQLALDILTILLAQIVFRQHKKAEWYAEKALVLHKLMAKHDEAAEVLLEGLISNISEESKDAMRPRAKKIANQQNIQLTPSLKEALIEYGTKSLILEKTFPADHVRKQHMESTNQRGKKKFEVFTADGKKFLDAEEFCILDYTTNGDFTHGGHWEGRIVTTIFHLLFWDIIYSKPRGVVGIFLSYFQLHPLDLYDESFYVNRKTLIDERLMKIEAMSKEEMVQLMKEKWNERTESELSGINRSIGWDNVQMVSKSLGSRAAAAICRRLATNYGHAHSGFPDLTLWNIHTNKVKFVEVKTDTDKPSMKQLQWMKYLRQNNIDTGFCYVGVASTRNRARASGTPAVSVKTVSEINSSGGVIT